MAEALFEPSVVSDFDGGNGKLLRCDGNGQFDIEIRSDANANWHQWFYFALNDCAGQQCEVRLVNAGEAAYVRGYEGYRALACEQDGTWRRVKTEYSDGILTIQKHIESQSCEFAYFVPFTATQHVGLIDTAKKSPLVRHEVLVKTSDGRDMDALHISRDGSGPKFQIWLIARQHPGESMAEWWMAGMLRRLLANDGADTRIAELLNIAEFHVVPNMNPDGSARGHIRGNAAGVDLNRAWQDPDKTKAAEVFHVRAAMEKTGVDFCLDIHGDEALPYVFLTGMSGVRCLNDHLRYLNETFQQACLKASTDFQIDKGYPAAKPGTANLAMCANFVAETYECLALTLEQPFKDNANAPDPENGWSPARSEALGAAFLNAIAAIAPNLRA